ncbi:hypothetical protein ERO13_D01G083900v2 [Gossypium hirsutum]|uniref:peptidylprolyl isomerase n=1 Tax=Gossypium hirsutum TaxID=3635 RepID=A0A1U8L4B4_GOSHI|nr:peptidyl-prolyl cis-trans isomerase FKBP43 isoform X1 [Gossypium hirsutum]KAG4161883.1 hypothetical protein ERO13_D01G083900v2 [Gossypium hirsutum]
MAFWGTEVKPGKPFTHAPLNGRLHLSQATLGMGDGIKKSIVQCNVGNKMPVFLCCLFPDKAECCQLNLEFEESDEVVFSVIGPRTVHLTGYYLSSSSLNHHNDESESYGEDIAGTETERSENGEESEYGGSFIDDEEPQVLSSSQDFSAVSESNEEMADLKIAKGDKGRPKRRLRKKYRNSGSENEESSSQKDFTSGVAAMEVLESETEDKLPISSLSWGKCTSKSGKANVEEKSRKETDNPSDNEIEDNVTMLKGTNAVRGVEPECKSGNRNGGKQKHELRVGNALVPKKKRGGLAKEEGLLEADHCMIEEVILEQNDQNKKLTSKKKCKYDNLLLASSQVDTEVGVKLKRKRKEQFEEKTLENNVNKEDETHKIGSNYTVTKYVDVEDRENQNQVNDNHSRKTKKKRRSKDEEGDAMKVEPPVLPAHEKKRSDVEMGAKNANDKEIQLSNGIIIEELEMGKPDGKIASLGKKVRVHYTGKLKESGQVFDSSVGRAHLKFRLGGKKVQELWNVGLDGMRIGGKRRLIVPPSVSYTNEGTSENIPPNSWLVFDVELIKVK